MAAVTDGRQDRSAATPTPAASGFAAIPEGRETGSALDAVAGALPDQLAADLLADHRAPAIAERLDELGDVLDPADVVDHLTRRLPDHVDSAAALILSRPRLPHLERQADQLRHARGRASPGPPTVDELVDRGWNPADAADYIRRQETA